MARHRRRTAATGPRPRARCAHRLASRAHLSYAHSCAFARCSGYAPPAYGGYAPPPYGAPPAYGGGYGAPAGYGGGAPVCHDYQNGRCFRATCKFSHEGPVRAAPGGGGGYGGGREVCHDFQNGRCFRGDSCRFAHSMDGAPPHAMMPSAMPGDWVCACGYSNFARNSNCNKCSAPRADGGPAAPYGGDTYHASANAAAAVADSMPSAPAKLLRTRLPSSNARDSARLVDRRRSRSRSGSRSGRSRSRSRSRDRRDRSPSKSPARKSKSRSKSPAGDDK